MFVSKLVFQEDYPPFSKDDSINFHSDNGDFSKMLDLYLLDNEMGNSFESDRVRIDCILANNGGWKSRLFWAVCNDKCKLVRWTDDILPKTEVAVILDDYYIGSQNLKHSVNSDLIRQISKDSLNNGGSGLWVFPFFVMNFLGENSGVKSEILSLLGSKSHDYSLEINVGRTISHWKDQGIGSILGGLPFLSTNPSDSERWIFFGWPETSIRTGYGNIVKMIKSSYAVRLIFLLPLLSLFNRFHLNGKQYVSRSYLSFHLEYARKVLQLLKLSGLKDANGISDLISEINTSLEASKNSSDSSEQIKRKLALLLGCFLESDTLKWIVWSWWWMTKFNNALSKLIKSEIGGIGKICIAEDGISLVNDAGEVVFDRQGISFKKFSEKEIDFLNEFFQTDMVFDSGSKSVSHLSAGEQIIFSRIVNLYRELHAKKVSKGYYLVMIDEPDLHLHLGWQRKYVKYLIDATFKVLLPWMDKDAKIHFVIATHSPFVISDILQDNVIMLDNGKRKDMDIKTFWANYAEIIGNGFFRDRDGILLGDFSHACISKLGRLESFIGLLEDFEAEKILSEDDYENRKKDDDRFWLLLVLMEKSGFWRGKRMRLAEFQKMLLLAKDLSKLKSHIWDGFIRDNIRYF